MKQQLKSLLSSATMNTKKTTLALLVILSNLVSSSQPYPYPSNENKIGVILDRGSVLENTLHICIKVAISDFYAVNSHYKTRIGLYIRDSKGEASRALSAVHRLLNKVKVQAILVLDSSLEGHLLALLADRAKVPFFCFACIPFSTQNPYLFQITPDETTLFKGIASVVESYKLTNVIVLYESTNSASQTIPYLVEYFKEKNIAITYSFYISPSNSHDQIFEQLDKVIAVGTTTIILHMSTSLASKVLLCAKMLRMLNPEYTWVIADKSPDILHSRSVAINSMEEGTLSLRPYIPSSNRLKIFISRWNTEYDKNYPTSEVKEMSVIGIRAYDVMWAVAECFEKARNRAKDKVSLTGPILANELRIKINDVNSEFQLMDGKLVSNVLEIVEVRGLQERRVGFWTLTDGIVKDLHQSSKSVYQYSNRGINAALWSQGSTTTHERKMSQTASKVKKLLIAVPKGWTFTELINVEEDLETHNTTYSGFVIDVFRTAMSALPYDYDFVTFPEPEGSTSKSYDDLVYHVYIQKYDGAVADLTILSNRSTLVDFTLPYTDLGVGKIERTQDRKDMWIFCKPFGLDVWLTIAASLAVMGSAVWLFEHPINDLFQGSASEQIGITLWFVFMSVFYAQRERLVSSWAKYIVIVWSFYLLILMACYTAILSSSLTLQQIHVASKGQIIGYVQDEVLGNNINYTDHMLLPYKTCKDYHDALSKGGKKGGADAIVDEIPYLNICLRQYKGFFSMVDSDCTTNGFGFAFRKGSPLVHDLSMEIAKLREDGTLARLENEWFSPSYLKSPDSADNKPKMLKFGDLSGLFLIGAVAFGLAFCRYIYKLFQDKINLLNKYILIIVAEGRLTMMLKYVYPRNQGWTIT